MLGSSEQIVIPARKGRAAHVAGGQIVKVINTHGQQVVDTWAFNSRDTREFMSMEHSRAMMGKLTPRVGDSLVTNHRRAILTLVEDTTPGVHDTLIAACDRYRYELLGVTGHHDSCTDNLAAAMKEIGAPLPETPSPLNLFMNIPVLDQGRLEFQPPVGKANQYVAFRAEMDLIIAFSACPQDIIPINGPACVPTEAHFTVE